MLWFKLNLQASHASWPFILSMLRVVMLIAADMYHSNATVRSHIPVH
jgi:hypothetical protein